MTLDGTYRQRHPEQKAFYQCREDYGQVFKESYPDFYEKDHGPLRPVVEKTAEPKPSIGKGNSYSLTVKREWPRSARAKWPSDWAAAESPWQ